MTIIGVLIIGALVVYVGSVVAWIIIGYRNKQDNPILCAVFDALAPLGVYSLIALIILAGGMTFAIEGAPTIAQVQERNLSALALTSNTEGSYSGGLFLSRGSIGSEDYYVVATVNGDGFSKIEKLSVDQVVYKETDEEVPRVVQTDMVRDTSSAKAKFWKVKPEVTSTSYALYIPKGSVSTEMNVNLENL